MNSNDTPTIACEPIIEMVRGELTSKKRMLYRLLLVVVCIAGSGLISLWITEPRPLPIRLHIGFGALTAICIGWVGVLSWILTRRRCPTALDRVAIAWMATIACSCFLIVAVPIGMIRGDATTAITLLAAGLPMLGFALLLLRQALQLKRTLMQKLRELERAETGAA